MKPIVALALPLMALVAGVAFGCSDGDSDQCGSPGPTDVEVGVFTVTGASARGAGQVPPPFDLTGAQVEVTSDEVRITYQRDGVSHVASYRVDVMHPPGQ